MSYWVDCSSGQICADGGEDPADSNPRITFGKFTQEGDRVLLPVNLTANHALVDGLHLAAFFDGMVQRAAHPEEYF